MPPPFSLAFRATIKKALEVGYLLRPPVKAPAKDLQEGKDDKTIRAEYKISGRKVRRLFSGRKISIVIARPHRYATCECSGKNTAKSG